MRICGIRATTWGWRRWWSAEDVEVLAPWPLRRFVVAEAREAAACRATELARRFA
jgi:hypothetical protein